MNLHYTNYATRNDIVSQMSELGFLHWSLAELCHYVYLKLFSDVPPDALELLQYMITVLYYTLKLFKEAFDCILSKNVLSHIWSGMSLFHLTNCCLILLAGIDDEWMLSGLLFIMSLAYRLVANITSGILLCSLIHILYCCSVVLVGIYDDWMLSSLIFIISPAYRLIADIAYGNLLYSLIHIS